MVYLQDNNLIEEKLFGQHNDFLRYCKEAGKKFVSESDREDFIAYRAEYSLTREQVEQIKKNCLAFKSESPPKKFFRNKTFLRSLPGRVIPSEKFSTSIPARRMKIF